MPSIDLKQYKEKKAVSTPSTTTWLTKRLNSEISFGGKQLPDKKKEALYLEMASLLQAGIDLKSSLELIAAGQRGDKDKRLFEDIKNAVLKGDAFSTALHKTEKFSSYEIFSLQIGEESGKITKVLEDLAKYYHNKIKQRRKIISALTYPCIILCASFGAILFMLKVVVPMFSDIIKRFGGQIPSITQAIINISNALQKGFPVLIIVFILLMVLYLIIRKTEQYRKLATKFILHIPVAGDLVQKIYLARFCNSMGLLIDARLPLLRAIILVRQMINFYPLEKSLERVEKDVTKGLSLNDSMQQFSIYPAKMIQLIKVGEETNRLDYFFNRIADQYIDEIEYKTTTLSTVIEPLILIVLGAVVGVILVSMYLPLFQMSNNIQ